MEASPYKILIADDSPSIVKLLIRSLKRSNMETIAAANGQEALEKFGDDVDGVLLDLNMPVMDGMECLFRIKELNPDIQPIMITASDEISNAVSAMKKGAFDYVVKPFDPNEIVALIHKAVAGYHQARKLKKLEKELEKAREQETRIAEGIQKTLLVGELPEDFPGLSISSLTIPSMRIDGDFFEFFQIDDKILDLAVGDVMGKGVPAALLAAAVKSRLWRVLYQLTAHPDSLYDEERDNQGEYRKDAGTFARPGISPCSRPSPEHVVQALQKRMTKRLEELETFLTLCYARFDLNRNQLSYVDCGHMRTIHFQAETRTVCLLEGRNMPVGFPETRPVEPVSCPFGKGDIFFFYSDGVTESRNPEGELFGEDRLVSLIEKGRNWSPEQVIEAVLYRVCDFQYPKAGILSAKTGNIPGNYLEKLENIIGEHIGFTDDFTCVAVRIDSGSF